MKNFTSIIFVFALLCGAVMSTAAQTTAAAPTTLTKAERKQVTDYLKSTRDKMLAELKGLSDAQMNFKPAPEKWSVREVAQHLALAEDFLNGIIMNQVMKTPAAPDKRGSTNGLEAKIMQAIPDRTSKFKAPEPIQPSDAKAPGDAADLFKTRRDNTIKFIKDTKEDLRVHFMDTPGLGAADAWQWFFFIAAHSERHTKQIQEVKADANFPKK